MPQIIVIFWVIKILTTGMGEVFSDFMMHNLGPVITICLGLSGLIAALLLQMHTRKYNAWIYWLAVAMVSVFGTMFADVLHGATGMSFQLTSLIFAVIMVVIFVLWYRSEGTLSIHSIFTKRRERFYWAIVLATFALGTAVGDMTARPLNLGYFGSGIMFIVLILIPLVLNKLFHVSGVFTFWFAYILTRPLGASFADWMGHPAERGGLGWGLGITSLVLTLLIIAFVAYLAITKKDVPVVVHKIEK